MSLFSKKQQSQAAAETGGDFEAAAARVTAEVEEVPVPGAAEGQPEKEGVSLLIRPEWAVFVGRSLFGVGAKFYHPAFALSDEQAEALGPKLLPLIQKVTDEWVPTWLGSVGNRNPELFDAVAAIAVTGLVQWQYVAKVRKMEAEQAAARQAERQADAGGGAVTDAAFPLPPKPKVGDIDAEGFRVI